MVMTNEMREFLANGGTIKICKPMKAKGSDTFKKKGPKAHRGAKTINLRNSGMSKAN
jgi:uncharacterized Zn ribbon protein